MTSLGSLLVLLLNLPASGAQTLETWKPVLGPFGYKYEEPHAGSPLHTFTPPTPDKLRKAGISMVSYELLFDIYHQDPRAIADPSVGTVHILLATDEAKAQAKKFFSEQKGANRIVVDGHTVWEAKHYYYREQGNEILYDRSRPPYWAQLDWDTASVVQLTDALAAILTDPTPANIARIAPADKSSTKDGVTTYEDARLTFTYSSRATQSSPTIVLSVRRPFPLTRLLAKLSLDKVILFSSDVHQSSWSLATVDRDPLRFHDWRLLTFVDESRIPATARARYRDSSPVTAAPLDTVFLTTLNAYREKK